MENARGEGSMFDFFRKRKQPIAVEFLELPSGMIVSEVDDPGRLEKLDHGHLFIETPNDFFAISSKGDVAFRYTKPQAKPRIIKVEKLELNPDSFTMKAQLSQPALFEFAKRQCLFLFETVDAFYIPSGESVVFYAKKEGMEKHGNSC